MSRIHSGFGGALFVNTFVGGGAIVTLREKGGGSGGGLVKGSNAMTVKASTTTHQPFSKPPSENKFGSKSKHKHSEKKEQKTRRCWGKPGGTRKTTT